MEEPITIPTKKGVLKPMSNEARKELDNLMDEAIRIKLTEYEARLAFAEATSAKVMQEFADLKAKHEVTEREVQDLHRESFRKLLEFTDTLTKINSELVAIENSVQNDEKAIDSIREYEDSAVRSVRAEEVKLLKKIRKQLEGKKTIDAMLRKLTTGKNKASFEKAVRSVSSGTKARVTLVNSVLKDKKLRAKLVADILQGARGKIKREKVTSKLTEKTAERVLKAVKPKMRKAAKTAAKSAAKQAVQTEANKA